jgi:hypothetical protein
MVADLTNDFDGAWLVLGFTYFGPSKTCQTFSRYRAKL